MVGYAAIGFFVVRIDAFMVRLVREENRAERRYHSALVDCLANIATVVTLRLQEPMRKMLRSRVLEVFAPLRRNIVFNEVKWGGIDLLNSGMRTGLVALYAWLDWRQRGTISVGTAVGGAPIFQQVGNVVASMAMHWNDLVRQKTEVADIDPILSSPARPLDVSAVPGPARDPRHGSALRPSTGRRRAAGARRRLSGAPPRQRIALIGASGAGKSSLLRVLAGLVDAERISIAVDGTPHPHLKHLARSPCSCRRTRGVRVQRPRERHHGAALPAVGHRARLRPGRPHPRHCAAASRLGEPHLRARAQSVGRTESSGWRWLAGSWRRGTWG